MDIQLKKDIEYLLSFAPCDQPEDVPEGLNPMFYFTNTYEGDRLIAERIAEIKSRYNIDQSSKSDDE
tara:strand:+ start:742 stop:942 length:201 start_codon:yes stop_codon:yes gene_type:complete